MNEIMAQEDILLTFKEAMAYLRVSRATLYRLMHAGLLVGHKVGCTWRFYREDLRACVGKEPPPPPEIPTDGREVRYRQSWYRCSNKLCACQQKYARVHAYWYADWKEGKQWISKCVGKEKPEGVMDESL